MTVEVLAISGPGGVGKSAVAFEASLILGRAGVAHALIDTDELDRVYPELEDAADFAQGNLAALWARFAARGVERLILVGVVLDRPDEAERIRQAIPGADIRHVRLMASAAELRARVLGREVGSNAAEQLERTERRRLALEADLRPEADVLETDGRIVGELAREVLRATDWLPGVTWCR